MIGKMLAAQYPDQIPSADDIESILFLPFVEGGIIKGRSTSGNLPTSLTTSVQDEEQMHQQQPIRPSQLSRVEKYSDIVHEMDTGHSSLLGSSKHDCHHNKSQGRVDGEDERQVHPDHDDDDDDMNDMSLSYPSLRYAKPEMSLRFPCFQIPEETTNQHHRKGSSMNARIVSSSTITTMDTRAKRMRFFLQEHESFNSSSNLGAHDTAIHNDDDDDDNNNNNNNNTEKNIHEVPPLLLPERSHCFPCSFPGMGCLGKRNTPKRR